MSAAKLSRRAFAVAPIAPIVSTGRTQRPNVVMVYVDQLCATAMRLYRAGGVETPNLARLANRGILFEHAYTPYPLCVPARVAMWTGQHPYTNGSRSNQTLLQDGRENMAAALSGAGYRLGLFGKNHCFTAPQLELWFSDDVSHGSKRWQAALSSEELAQIRKHRAWIRERGGANMAPDISPFPPEIHDTHLIMQRALEFIERRKDEPFFAWVSIPDPHHPVQTPMPFAGRVPPERVELPRYRAGSMTEKITRTRIHDYLIRGGELSDDFLRKYLSIYYGMTAFIDHEVGRMLDALERLRLANKTAVIFTSDHGDFAAEHRLFGKTGCLLDCMVRIPLIVSFPGRVPTGVRERALVTHLDLMPTLLEWCGLPVSRGAEGIPLPFDGQAKRRACVYSEYGAGGEQFTWDEARAIGPAKRLGDYALSSRAEQQALQKREHAGHLQMLRTHTHKLILDSNGECEFYDLERDPWELENVHGKATYRSVENELRRKLETGAWRGA